MLTFIVGKKWCRNAMLPPHLVSPCLTDDHSSHRASAVLWERALLGTTWCFSLMCLSIWVCEIWIPAFQLALCFQALRECTWFGEITFLTKYLKMDSIFLMFRQHKKRRSTHLNWIFFLKWKFGVKSFSPELLFLCQMSFPQPELFKIN